MKKLIIITAIALTSGCGYFQAPAKTIEEVTPLISGKWIYNPGACSAVFALNGFYDINIFTEPQEKAVLNRIMLHEGVLSQLEPEKVKSIVRTVGKFTSTCEAIKTPSEKPTVFNFKHPLKEYVFVYYPESDLLFKFENNQMTAFQRYNIEELKKLPKVE